MSAISEISEAPTGAHVDKSGDRVRRMFGQIADRYDLSNHVLSMGVDRYWRWRTVRQVPPVGSQPILDLCTGTGDLAFAYLGASRNAPVIGADFCRPMLEVALRKKRSSKAGDRLGLVEADAQSLPFANDSFAVVTVAFGLRNVADTNRGLAEMVRVCRPGGQIAVLEFSMPTRQPLRGLYRWYFQHVLPRIGQALARNREHAYNYLPASVEEFPAGKALVGLLRASGLDDVRFMPLTFGVATLYVGTK